MNKNEKRYEKELERVGVDNETIGPVDCICVTTEEDGRYRFYDDHADVYLTETQVNQLFKNLPDNAGWERFWEETAKIEPFK